MSRYHSYAELRHPGATPHHVRTRRDEVMELANAERSRIGIQPRYFVTVEPVFEWPIAPSYLIKVCTNPARVMGVANLWRRLFSSF